jgi:hypothetical protein
MCNYTTETILFRGAFEYGGRYELITDLVIIIKDWFGEIIETDGGTYGSGT